MSHLDERQHVGEHVSARAVHAARVGLAAEGLGLALQRLAVQELGGAQGSAEERIKINHPSSLMSLTHLRKSASAPAGPVTAVTEYPRCASSTVATLPTPPGVPDTSTGPAPGSTPARTCGSL